MATFDLRIIGIGYARFFCGIFLGVSELEPPFLQDSANPFKFRLFHVLYTPLSAFAFMVRHK